MKMKAVAAQLSAALAAGRRTSILINPTPAGSRDNGFVLIEDVLRERFGFDRERDRVAGSLGELGLARATVAKKPAHRGEHEVSRKAIAQGMSECFRSPVCSCAPNAQFLAHGSRRVQRAPGIPCAWSASRP